MLWMSPPAGNSIPAGSCTPAKAAAGVSAIAAMVAVAESAWGIGECSCMPGRRFNWKQDRQKTGRPCVGLNGTVVSTPQAEHSVRVSVRESGRAATTDGPLSARPSPARFALQSLQRFGSFVNWRSRKNNCSPAVKIKSLPQSEHFNRRSTKSMTPSSNTWGIRRVARTNSPNRALRGAVQPVQPPTRGPKTAAERKVPLPETCNRPKREPVELPLRSFLAKPLLKLLSDLEEEAATGG